MIKDNEIHLAQGDQLKRNELMSRLDQMNISYDINQNKANYYVEMLTNKELVENQKKIIFVLIKK